MCSPDKNYYFCRSIISVTTLIGGSRKKIELSKIWVCKELDKQQDSFLPNTDIFLVFFIVFECGGIFESLGGFKIGTEIYCRITSLAIFGERFRTINRNSTIFFKKLKISVKIVVF